MCMEDVEVPRNGITVYYIRREGEEKDEEIEVKKRRGRKRKSVKPRRGRRK